MCINIVGGFECKCKKGYIGINCEEGNFSL